MFEGPKRLSGPKRGVLFVPIGLLVVLLLSVYDTREKELAWVAGVALSLIGVVAWLALRRLSLRELGFASAGGGIGMIVGFLTFTALSELLIFGGSSRRLAMDFVFFNGLFGFTIGWGLGMEKAGEALSRGVAPGAGANSSLSLSSKKLLDTSVLIDGRIADMAKAGFLDGPLLIPQFVLRELQGIADSSDPLKRARGRRGLDVAKRLQETPELVVDIGSEDYRDEREVDDKLIRLAAETGAALVTNDFNLNKVASVRHIKVLNLNDLVNALKTIFLPGEELVIPLSREGKDPTQGVGYLDDGTMVVVDGGQPHIGQSVKCIVTNVHQTAAGRMIFTRYEGLAKKDSRPTGR